MQIESPVQVSIQLRRPSDGAVSESRSFEFIPLDAGRAYWSAKRLKTNYSVFNQILSRDQAIKAGEVSQPQHELKHKVPLSRAPVMAGIFTADTTAAPPSLESGESGMYEAAPASPHLGQVRQTLKPVAMPGGVQSAAPPSFPSQPEHNSPHLTSLSGTQNKPGAPILPPAARPNSDLSIMSDFSSLTLPDNVSINTRQSVNEILSMADISVYSGEMDSLSVNTLLQSPVKEEPAEVSGLTHHSLGSLTSVATVATVKEVRQSVAKESPMDITEQSLDLDIGQIYDDVMQCVYDDVDIKYDDVEILTDQPPVPPLRKKDVSIEPDIDKPLPAAPRNNILTKITEKKNELLTAREKEMEKKRKEKEELEEQKKKEREEKEKKKKEEKEAKRKEEEEKKAKLEEQKLKSSLFQRLFQRSQSRPGETGEGGQEILEQEPPPDTIPPVPPHQPAAYMSQVSIDNQLEDLEQLIQSGELERLDSVVSEFTSQFPAETVKTECSQTSPAVQT